jgi:hypothetical protein
MMRRRLDKHQQLDFICLCISDHFRDAQLGLQQILQHQSSFENASLCSTFQPVADYDERIAFVSVRIIDICRKYLTKDEAQEAVLYAFKRCADKNNHLLPLIEEFLDTTQDFD